MIKKKRGGERGEKKKKREMITTQRDCSSVALCNTTQERCFGRCFGRVRQRETVQREKRKSHSSERLERTIHQKNRNQDLPRANIKQDDPQSKNVLNINLPILKPNGLH